MTVCSSRSAGPSGNVTFAEAQAALPAETVQALDRLANDYVDHYDKAVIVGTNDRDYINDQKRDLFQSMVIAAHRHQPARIDLKGCIDDLIRQGDVGYNLDLRVFSR